jgi:nitroimidazol reductase NimA-like FMN-containing flavoprotein (pyridoxamine 5'-phosphate oxidase superfamily)
MSIVKIQNMEKKEYDRLIRGEYIARIVFKGEKYPYIAPFLYVFDGKYMYFLSTKYGIKMEYFRQNPNASVEVEKYSKDLSNYVFVVLSGRIVEVDDQHSKKYIRDHFVHLIKEKNLAKNIMIALGHSIKDPVEDLILEEKNMIWKLVDVEKIVGFKNG